MKRIAVGVLAIAAAAPARGQQPLDRTRDRGTGIPSSQFGTYLTPGTVVVYPFFEYYHDNNFEYAPADLGFGGDVDFRGDTAPARGCCSSGSESRTAWPSRSRPR